MSYNSIHSNLAANSANYNISRASTNAAYSVSRLSSGNRIARASDDVAAMTVGSRLASQISGLRGSLTNATQGSSMMQVASGGMDQIIDILERQKALAVQAQNGSLTAAERSYINTEFQALTEEIDQIAGSTNFNSINLLSGAQGTTIRLANSNAVAAAFTPGAANASAGSGTASTTAIQGFHTQTGASQAGFGAAGQINITDVAGTTLANAQYDDASLALRGQFSSFRFSNVTYNTGATLTATINGVEFSGSVAHNATSAILGNGNSYIRIGTGTMNLANAGSVSAAESTMAAGFATTTLMRTSVVQGVDFSGTAMSGVTGAGASGIAMFRGAGDPTNLNISNFQYAGNAGAADTSTITVDINGKTFSATSVNDAVDAGAATTYTFAAGDGEALTLNITGLTTAITNIRTSTSDRANFINSLNIGFSRSGSGMEFNLGDANNPLAVQYGAATSAALYNGQTLSVNTTGTAASAEAALDTALENALGIQADIGAFQESFDYSASSISSSILGQDEARANYLDTDIAQESTDYATYQVQIEAGVAVLAQANRMQSTLLTLLQQQ